MTNAVIAPEADLLTLINVYEVELDRQQVLADALAQVTDNFIRHQPGFISVSIHASLDRRKLVNYAQWASKADFEAFMARPETQQSLKQFAALAISVSPSLYSVKSVHLK